MACRICQAEVDVNAVSHTARCGFGGKTGPPAQLRRKFAGNLADCDPPVRRLQTRGGAADNFKLIPAIFSQKHLWLSACFAQGRNQQRAERIGTAQRRQRKGRRGRPVGPDDLKFLLKRRDDFQPGFSLQIGKRRFQQAAHTAQPRFARKVGDIGVVEMQRRSVGYGGDPHLGSRVRHQPQIADRSEWVRAGNFIKRGQREVCGNPADPLAKPAGKIAQRDCPAPGDGGNIGGNEGHQFIDIRQGQAQPPRRLQAPPDGPQPYRYR